MNLLFDPFLICRAWKPNCVLPLGVFPAGLGGLLWEIFLVGFFGILCLFSRLEDCESRWRFQGIVMELKVPFNFRPSEGLEEGGRFG